MNILRPDQHCKRKYGTYYSENVVASGVDMRHLENFSLSPCASKRILCFTVSLEERYYFKRNASATHYTNVNLV